MHRQTVQFAVTRNKGNITGIGRTSILQPRTNQNSKADKSNQTIGRMVFAGFDSLYAHFNRPLKVTIKYSHY